MTKYEINILTVASIIELFLWNLLPCGLGNSTNVLEKAAAHIKLCLQMLYTRNLLTKPIRHKPLIHNFYVKEKS